MDLHDFEIVAENYDYYARTLVTEQAHAQKIDFHLELAGEYGGSGIVDIACGTGDVAIPLAEAGQAVHAFDVSEAMISRFKVKIADADPSVQRKIDITLQNMVDFTYDRTFSLAMIPASGFMHLTTPEDQRKALSNINRHLEIGGVLTLNTFDPNMGRIAENLDEATEYRKRTEFDR